MSLHILDVHLGRGIALKADLFRPNPPMDGARTTEGGEGVTGEMIQARILVAGRIRAVCRRCSSEFQLATDYPTGS